MEPESQMPAGGKSLLLFLSFICRRGLSGLLTRPVPTSSPLLPVTSNLWAEGQLSSAAEKAGERALCLGCGWHRGGRLLTVGLVSVPLQFQRNGQAYTTTSIPTRDPATSTAWLMAAALPCASHLGQIKMFGKEKCFCSEDLSGI